MIRENGIHLGPSGDIDLLVALLEDADESVIRIRAAVESPSSSAYLIVLDGSLVGAALMAWQNDTSELIYIAVNSDQRGRGIGKRVIAHLQDEARQRDVKSLIVGTANAGLDNSAFYQKCGFRIDSVRKDYFDYFTELVFENGIRIRDMLMLRWNVK